MTEIRYLKEQEKGDTVPLWREAFPEDSDGFLEYYYREKTRDNQVLAVQEGTGENRQIVSMLHRNPYRLKMGNHIVDSDYIIAVATAKDHRHQGLMRRLLIKMTEDMHEERMPFCYLMPADRRIYEPFDFVYIYDQEYWRLTKEAEGKLRKRKVQPGDGENARTAAEWMEQWIQKENQVWAVRDQAYVERLLKELDSEKGWMELLYDREIPVGIRCWWGIGKTEQRMLLCEKEYREKAKEDAPAIMGRITDLERFLKLFSLKEDSPAGQLEAVLYVEDRLCLWNQGTFLWKLDRTGSSVTRREQQPPEEALRLEISVGDLTRWLFGYKKPEVIVRAEQADERWQWIHVCQGVFLDEIV